MQEEGRKGISGNQGVQCVRLASAAARVKCGAWSGGHGTHSRDIMFPETRHNVLLRAQGLSMESLSWKCNYTKVCKGQNFSFLICEGSRTAPSLEYCHEL